MKYVSQTPIDEQIQNLTKENKRLNTVIKMSANGINIAQEKQAALAKENKRLNTVLKMSANGIQKAQENQNSLKK